MSIGSSILSALSTLQLQSYRTVVSPSASASGTRTLLAGGADQVALSTRASSPVASIRTMLNLEIDRLTDADLAVATADDALDEITTDLADALAIVVKAADDDTSADERDDLRRPRPPATFSAAGAQCSSRSQRPRSPW